MLSFQSRWWTDDSWCLFIYLWHHTSLKQHSLRLGTEWEHPGKMWAARETKFERTKSQSEHFRGILWILWNSLDMCFQCKFIWTPDMSLCFHSGLRCSMTSSALDHEDLQAFHDGLVSLQTTLGFWRKVTLEILFHNQICIKLGGKCTQYFPPQFVLFLFWFSLAGRVLH